MLNVKPVIYISMICILSGPVLGHPTSCKISQPQLLSEEALEKLTLNVCPREESSQLDIHSEYEEQFKIKTARDFLIYQYTDKCYKTINSELFKTSNQDSQIMKISEQLDAVLCEYPQFKKEVFRGAYLTDEAFKKQSQSQEISFPAFSSASQLFDIACDFAKNGNSLFKIISKSGRAIDKHSKHSFEAEVLFRRNTQFKVLKTWTGPEASTKSGCEGISHYLELEETIAPE